MGVVPKSFHQQLHVLVNERMEIDLVRPFLQLFVRREFAVQDQVGDFEIRAFVCQLLDRVTRGSEECLCLRR